MDVEIRKAKPNEAHEIIEINNIVWSYTYKDLLPNEIIERKRLRAPERIVKWKNLITEKNNVFVALVNNKIVGYHSFGLASNVEYENCGEIYAAYILKDYQGLQIGRRLTIACMEELIKSGFNSMVTRCLDGNIFNEYHKSIGGIFIKKEDCEILGYPVKENLYYHENLSTSYEMNLRKLKNIKSNINL